MKLITNIFYCLFIALLLGVLGLFIVPSLPIQQNIELKIVESGSMEPNLMTGALVVVAPAKEYKMGEVITFSSQYSDIPTTHRIANIELIEGQTYYTTKGDANEEADTAKIISSDIIGKVYVNVPYAGFILDFARQPIGFTCLIVLPALLIILGEISKIFGEWRRLRQPKAIDQGILTPQNFSAPILKAEPAPKLMLDIATPVRFKFNEQDYVLVIPAIKRQSSTRAGRATFAAVAVIVLVGIGFSNLNLISSTFSFARDEETASKNTFIAQALDFTVTEDASNFIFDGQQLIDEDGAVAALVVPSLDSGSLIYNVAVQEISGSSAFCAALLTDFTDPFTYSGTLTAMSASNVEFIAPWSIPVTLSGDANTYAGSDCVVDLVFTARHPDSGLGSGYTDEERITLTFTLPALLAPLQLNEASTLFSELNAVVEEIPLPKTEIIEIPESPEALDIGISPETEVKTTPE